MCGIIKKCLISLTCCCCSVIVNLLTNISFNLNVIMSWVKDHFVIVLILSTKKKIDCLFSGEMSVYNQKPTFFGWDNVERRERSKWSRMPWDVRRQSGSSRKHRFKEQEMAWHLKNIRECGKETFKIDVYCAFILQMSEFCDFLPFCHLLLFPNRFLIFSIQYFILFSMSLGGILPFPSHFYYLNGNNCKTFNIPFCFNCIALLHFVFWRVFLIVSYI